MAEQAPAPPAAVGGGGGRKESSIDPVKAQGILAAVCRKNRAAARVWHERWGFYTRLREIQEEEAMKMGFTLEDYRAQLHLRCCKPEPKLYPVKVDPSPKPLPPTSSAMIGRRATCPLERYRNLVMTPRNYPIHPPLPPGQVYDPYKQTLFFLGSVPGDPISHKLPPAVQEVTDDMWTRPRQLTACQFNEETLKRALQARPEYNNIQSQT